MESFERREVLLKHRFGEGGDFPAIEFFVKLEGSKPCDAGAHTTRYAARSKEPASEVELQLRFVEVQQCWVVG